MEDKPYQDFAERLVKLRKQAGLTRKELAELVGTAPSTLFYYESGSRMPGADTAFKIAQIFGITVEDLLGVPDAAPLMEKGSAVEDISRLYGNQAAASAQAYLDGTSALLAGGTLSTEEQLDFISVMRKVLIDAEIRAKEKYTPNRFRTPVWQKNTEEIRSSADDLIRSVDQQMQERDTDGGQNR